MIEHTPRLEKIIRVLKLLDRNDGEDPTVILTQEEISIRAKFWTEALDNAWNEYHQRREFEDSRRYIQREKWRSLSLQRNQ